MPVFLDQSIVDCICHISYFRYNFFMKRLQTFCYTGEVWTLKYGDTLYTKRSETKIKLQYYISREMFQKIYAINYATYCNHMIYDIVHCQWLLDGILNKSVTRGHRISMMERIRGLESEERTQTKREQAHIAACLLSPDIPDRTCPRSLGGLSFSRVDRDLDPIYPCASVSLPFILFIFDTYALARFVDR